MHFDWSHQRISETNSMLKILPEMRGPLDNIRHHRIVLENLMSKLPQSNQGKS